ncbi:MAG TPA: hypothetical protein VHI13_14990 [Candidatus Kapabacteria bacterium]|nr:hypothetical protein [Candidatus Kapabacteria bacterium]
MKTNGSFRSRDTGDSREVRQHDRSTGTHGSRSITVSIFIGVGNVLVATALPLLYVKQPHHPPGTIVFVPVIVPFFAFIFTMLIRQRWTLAINLVILVYYCCAIILYLSN